MSFLNCKTLQNDKVMTEYELDKYCDAHKNCDCNCMKCFIFKEYMREELGYNN